MTAWEWPNSKLVRVIDGDTLIVEVKRDLGFHGLATFTQRIRLNRINAPKVTSEPGKDARDVLYTMLGDHPFHLTTVAPYKYGDEWMGEIIVGSENVSDWMVKNEYAVYWNGEGPRPNDG